MGFLEEQDFSNLPTIPEFYKGKTIFITGGSGFMGKVLVEKLLYSCSDLDRIYLLMRDKKGVKAEDRLDKLYSIPCFDRLREDKPTIFREKVFMVNGDVTQIGLGLSVEDRALLVNRVNIIFHGAASVRFDDPLPYAIQMNLKGTKEVMDIAKDMRNIQAVVHISTSYTNTNRNPIEEVLYPPLADWRDTVQVCETVDVATLQVLTPKYIGELPNTYTFSKQLTESVVGEYRGQIPVVIIRPSIVISSMQEPIPGWIDNFNGPTGMMIAVGKGILHSFYSKKDIKLDYIPVDVAIRSLVVASWIRGTKQLEVTDDISVYNCCFNSDKRVKMTDVADTVMRIQENTPVDNPIWYPNLTLTTSKTVNYIQFMLFQLLPALILDAILRLLGRKPMFLKIQNRMYTATQALHYYAINEWIFVNKNMELLRSCIKEEDKDQFYYELWFTDVYQYFKTSSIGWKKYLLNEKLENIPKMIAYRNRLYVLDKIVKFVFYAYLFRWLYSTVIAYVEN